MRKTVKWDSDTRETILAARQRLEEQGWLHISIRKVLYQLLDLPGWTKKHYDTMCVKLGEWRDDGTIAFGLFADVGGGDHVPMVHKASTPEEIERAIEFLRSTVPARLSADGYYHVVLVEHAEDVDDIARMLDPTCVVSSGGQIRREHLHAVFRRIESIVSEWGGKGVRVIMLVDYDKGGEDIYETHRKWLKRIFNIDVRKWGITSAQIRAAGLPPNEDHQLEGWSGRYGHDRLRRELREAVGLAP